MEPRPSSPPNDVANAPEPRSSSPPRDGVPNAPEPRSSSPPPQPDGEPNAIQPRPATPPPQDGFIDLGPRSFPLFPRVEPHTNGPLSSSPPFPSDEPDATEPKAAEPDATEPQATDDEPRHNDVEKPVPARHKSLSTKKFYEPKWEYKISEDSLKLDASDDEFFTAWQQSTTPRGLLRKIDREEVRLLKIARVRAALHRVSQDHYAECRGWCSKRVENFNSWAEAKEGFKKYAPRLPDSTNERPLRYLFTTITSYNPLFRPMAIYEADGRVHAIYVEFGQCGYFNLERPSWTRKSWRTCVEFDSDGHFKKTESFLMTKEEVFKGPVAEMMKFANRVQEVGTTYVD
ncbi:hypothetical protein CSOJ01_08517 [Colletotrichum sojae]|uniref:Uncharacterized protein n=1 Tax=Colletotrichum sojae TaxID=2175907 RepID=A0A8H6MSS5_9PEZI|nr:hypothetical protein CSOJ01_08517 [Colletotrichum sojae]